MEYPEFSTYNYLTFARNKEKGLKYREWLNEIAPLLSDLNSLNSKKVCKNYKKMSRVQGGLEDDIDDILEHFPTVKNYFFSLAKEYIKSNKHRCAIRVLETCVELFPDDPNSSYLLADAYYESGFFDLSIDYYLTTVGLNLTDIYARASVMLSYVEIELFNDAFYEYQMALMVDSTDDFLHGYAGELFLAIEESEIHHPFTAEVETKDTVYEISLDRDDLLIYALESYSKAIKFSPLIPYYYTSRAGIHEKLYNYKQALEDYDYAIYLNPNDYKVYTLRAEAKLQLGDKEGYEADRDLSKTIRKRKKKRN
jgi:tetratricopeptide (TPR) repeat protein